MIIPSQRKDFGKAITPSPFFEKENYQGRNLKAEVPKSLIENKRYQTQVSWIQATYPPIYNFKNQKLGQFTPSLELEGYEYQRTVDPAILLLLEKRKSEQGDSNYPNRDKSLFIDKEEYEQQVKNRFKKQIYQEPKEYIRPLITFKHSEKYLENNSKQTITDKNNRKKNQSYSEQVRIPENPSKTRSYNIQHINDFKQRQNERINDFNNMIPRKINNFEIQPQNNVQIQNNSNLHALNEDNKLTLKDPHLNYIANNIEQFEKKINKMK